MTQLLLNDLSRVHAWLNTGPSQCQFFRSHNAIRSPITLSTGLTGIPSRHAELHAPISSEARADARYLTAPTTRLDGRTHTRDVRAAVKTRLQSRFALELHMILGPIGEGGTMALDGHASKSDQVRACRPSAGGTGHHDRHRFSRVRGHDRWCER